MTTKSLKQMLRPKVFFFKFDGDMSASQLSSLRQQVTLILKVATPYDEVMVISNSPGGLVTEYGLAASQLIRIKNAGLKLTICVDSIAASGGYMIASVANEIVAAPFALVGSIGVVAYVPNFQRFLEDKDVDVYEFTAGKWKRTVDVVGKVTEEGKEKLQSELDEIHFVFKEHIRLNRPAIHDINKIATGEAWLAVQAKDLGLVDTIMTSDDWLMQKLSTHEVIEIVENNAKKGIAELFANSGLESNLFSNSSNSSPSSYIPSLLMMLQSIVRTPSRALSTLVEKISGGASFLKNKLQVRKENITHAYETKVHIV